MKRLFLVATVATAALVGSPLHGADEPYLALLTGFKCSQCHVNRTGGGGRNAFGNVWAQTALPIKSFDVRSRNLSDWVAIGFDVRTRFRAAVQTAVPQTQFDIPEAQVQLEAQVIPRLLTLYLDQTVGPEQAFTREAFVMAQWKPANGYVKAGKMLLPYGWRLWDDDAFIRSATRFTFGTPDIGVEVGIEPGPLMWVMALTNGSSGGSEGDNGKMLTGQAALVYPAFRIGVSGSHNSQATLTRDLVGGFGGFSVGPVAVLGEADWIRENNPCVPASSQISCRQVAAYVEGNVLTTRGVNAKVTYGYFDPDLDVDEDQLTRMRFGLEVFPVNALQLSAFYVWRDAPPSIEQTDVVTLELHFHF